MVRRNKGITFRSRQIRGRSALAINPLTRDNHLIEPPIVPEFVGPDVINWGLVDAIETNLTGGEIVHYFRWNLAEFTGSGGTLSNPVFRAVMSTTTGSFSASLEVLSASTVLFSLSSSSEAPETVLHTITTEQSTVWQIKLATEDETARAVLGGVSIFIEES